MQFFLPMATKWQHTHLNRLYSIKVAILPRA
nr:MAG TPA: hypothetical protein [Caudoviricetes sp.]